MRTARAPNPQSWDSPRDQNQLHNGMYCSQLMCHKRFHHSKRHKLACAARAALLERGVQQAVTCRRRVLLYTALASTSLPRQATAANNKETTEIYDKASGSYDQLDDGFLARLLGLSSLRNELIGSADGNVLEIAVGTGLNMPLYDRRKVLKYTGLDLSPGMLEQAGAKLEGLNLRGIARLQQGDVETLPFGDNTFDTVVSTYSLCVFQHPEQALKEMARVTKPGGKLLLLEHSRSNFGLLSAYQDLTADAVAATSKGCVWNQDLPKLFHKGGLKVKRFEQYLGGLIALVEASPAFKLSV